MAEKEAIFAAGCFWSIEDTFRKMPGVKDAISGYTGGSTPNPTYQQVCTGGTGHAEAVRVIFDDDKVDYRTLLNAFFEMHDPTQVIRSPSTRRARHSPAVPTPQPRSSTACPASAGTDAASRTASIPARYPYRGCSSRSCPPRNSSSVSASRSMLVSATVLSMAAAFRAGNAG